MEKRTVFAMENVENREKAARSDLYVLHVLHG